MLRQGARTPVLRLSFAATLAWQVYGNTNVPVLSAIPVFDTINVSPDSLAQTLGVGEGSFSWLQSGNDVYLEFTAPAEVLPEPATYGVLTALGLIGIGLWRRRRAAA